MGAESLGAESLGAESPGAEMGLQSFDRRMRNFLVSLTDKERNPSISNSLRTLFMKSILNTIESMVHPIAIASLCTVMTSITLLAGSASAAPANGMDKGYVGGGLAGSVTNGGTGSDGLNFGGNLQGRAPIAGTPVSVRGTVLFNGNNSAVVPVVTYDMPVAPGTNVYAGVGGAFVQNQGVNSPIGTRNSVVLNAGVETQVAKGVVVYTDAKLGINAYQNSPASALGLSGGVGIQF